MTPSKFWVSTPHPGPHDSYSTPGWSVPKSPFHGERMVRTFVFVSRPQDSEGKTSVDYL